MKAKFSLSKKILLKFFISITLLTFVINSVAFYLYTREIRGYLFQDAKKEITLSLIENKDLVRELGISSYCETIKKYKRLRVTLISSDGVVTCDTYTQTFNNHLDRPEVRSANNKDISFSSRFSNTAETKMIYGAQKIFINNDEYYLRLSLPVFSIEADISSLYKNTLLKVAPIITIIIILFFAISLWYSKSITQIINKTFRLGSRFNRDENIDDLNRLENVLDQVDSEFEKNFEALRFEIEKNSTLLQSISDGILAIDKNLRVLFYNVRFTRFFNYHKVTHNNLVDLMNPEIMENFKACLDDGIEKKLFGLKIDKKIIDLSIAPIVGKKGKTLGAIAIFRNVTEKKKVEQMRVDFVANVSHELKTPLTSIKGYSQLLLDEKEQVSDKTKNYIEKILNNSERLIDLFENLLALSKIEAKDKLELSPFIIEDHVHDIIDYLKSKNKNKNIVLKENYLVNNFSANEKLFRQVLFNLLENAVKYSGDNVTIKIYTKREKDHVLISVEDDGVGIEEEKLSRIFERFYRANESRSGNIKGSGIGLSIVKHIVNKHHGEIEVFALKKGTEFLIRLPY